ncbi:methylated-DNA--[protein]-cysteine S-methyltransferase [Mucilaginibacter daejeonensis]|uniref:methylated-DNA--[protein]-cysteine S-methyltransferase n=1 Tax=Mucilaginibacter daejeonensis TaxID=398049 RepID=UPI001D17789B|nr:methylated-DNA--[protein]-cysteine S-methyltransferase [Mucilaginibacter daejeonensis]UEG51976.1 methylated-DNA--[protein]-cysteine S-methyltransferase [Mucilaginibacter daejeonensis]
MLTQIEIDHDRIAKAIGYLKQHYAQQPSLDEVAAYVGMSAFHFQRMFTQWAGISPKRFVQYLSVEHAKNILSQKQATLFDAAIGTGLSGTGRLHDLFVKIEGMTPGDYKNGGQDLHINYSFQHTPFGTVLVAATAKGVCYVAFADEDEEIGLGLLKQRFPNASYHHQADELQQRALSIFTRNKTEVKDIKLHLKGTPFQLKVWDALLKIATGDLTTYAALARSIDHPKACRAVGSAVGDNPVAYLIPCHRVIRSTGESGQYHWGAHRKSAMIGWEAARVLNNDADVSVELLTGDEQDH